jgi:hypothetical protein
MVPATHDLMTQMTAAGWSFPLFRAIRRFISIPSVVQIHEFPLLLTVAAAAITDNIIEYAVGFLSATILIVTVNVNSQYCDGLTVLSINGF